MKTLTAEEFLRNSSVTSSDSYDFLSKQELMIEFAKMHVQEALKQASEKAFVEYTDLETKEKFDYTDVINDDNVGADVNKDSILNAYSLENIK